MCFVRLTDTTGKKQTNLWIYELIIRSEKEAKISN